MTTLETTSEFRVKTPMPPGASPRRGRHAHTYADGSTYTGDFGDGLPHGEGSIAYSGGNRCVGS